MNMFAKGWRRLGGDTGAPHELWGTPKPVAISALALSRVLNPSVLPSPVSTANEYACKGLDKLEEKLPILQQPPEKVPCWVGSVCVPPPRTA